MKTGVIILGHGSKAEESNQAFHEFCQMTEESLNYDLVTGCALQFAEPRLNDAVADAVEVGMERLIVVPLFLFPGNHVQKDVPKALDKLKEEYTDVEFIYADHIGSDDRLTEIVADRIKEVV
ncbi:sirohydrochlorin chelatase [Selenihalanaerobacter shriftii]|uniref:CbiX protein n=1 Tax=Selenihalanaerobacter shriftii TaxID=142842 RepID=A0A1T4K3L0_9FIRM|nr:CbiX/SirB N-terminal domain-containing protein [Selenihalanaerobacter shriftii]SJZ36998.1 CbiX protein [Selenihalanaerobacter shriftii]